MKVEGLFTVKNGNKKQSIKNKFVESGTEALILPMLIIRDSAAENGYGNNYNIEIGSDTTTATEREMVSLVNSISNNPDNTSIDVVQNDDEYYVKYTATWDSGSVSGTLGEVGINLYIPDHTNVNSDYNPQPPYSAGWINSFVQLLSRICEADGDFTSFTIDETSPLVIEYKLSLTYQV